MDLRKLILEDVRCFAGRQEFDIRPLTFLVGENSTGKTTALGCFQIMHDFIFGNGHGLDFNAEPYLMGSFRDIVRRSNPGKTKFRIGVEFQPESSESVLEYILELSAKDRRAEPIIQEQSVRMARGEITFKERKVGVDADDMQTEYLKGFELVEPSNADGCQKTTVISGRYHLDKTVLDLLLPINRYRRPTDKWRPETTHVLVNLGERPPSPFGEEWKEVFGKEHLLPSEAYSFAPIRTNPLRTYDPLREDMNPAGSDIPMVIRNMFISERDRWKKLKGNLVAFGKSSGLFTDVYVRALGKSSGDPFQLQIKVKGPRVNMKDVGHGVSQILPILVRILDSPPNMVFLMQQPEVHLHPRAQSEFSSLLIEAVKRKKHGFVIETHSDHLINRARIEIMSGEIAPQDVSLIYLEPVGNRVKVHNIQFDKQANLRGVPRGYRNFFIDESDKLLGLST